MTKTMFAVAGGIVIAVLALLALQAVVAEVRRPGLERQANERREAEEARQRREAERLKEQAKAEEARVRQMAAEYEKRKADDAKAVLQQMSAEIAAEAAKLKGNKR